MFLFSLLLGLSGLATAEPMPEFRLSGGGVELSVQPEMKSFANRFLVQVKETLHTKRDDRIISVMREKGFNLEGLDTITFLIPEKACLFSDRLFHCSSAKLSTEDAKKIEIRFSDSTYRLPFVAFKAKDLPSDAVAFRFHTQLQTISNINMNGGVDALNFLDFHSQFWLYQDDQVNGHFIQERRLNL